MLALIQYSIKCIGLIIIKSTPVENNQAGIKIKYVKIKTGIIF